MQILYPTTHQHEQTGSFAVVNLDRLNDMFARPYNNNEYGPLGSLFISREAQGFYAIAEKNAREALTEEYSRFIEKNHTVFLKNQKETAAPLVTTGMFALSAVSKYDDSKVDNKLLLENIRKEFGCSQERAADVIKRSRVRPEKRSLKIIRVNAADDVPLGRVMDR